MINDFLRKKSETVLEAQSKINNTIKEDKIMRKQVYQSETDKNLDMVAGHMKNDPSLWPLDRNTRHNMADHYTREGTVYETSKTEAENKTFTENLASVITACGLILIQEEAIS